MGRNQALQEIAADRDRNVIESTFIRIGDINSNTFLEKRDNVGYPRKNKAISQDIYFAKCENIIERAKKLEI